MREPEVHNVPHQRFHTDIIVLRSKELLPVIPFPQTPIACDSMLVQIFGVCFYDYWRHEGFVVEFSGRGIAGRTSLKLANDFVIFTHLSIPLRDCSNHRQFRLQYIHTTTSQDVLKAREQRLEVPFPKRERLPL